MLLALSLVSVSPLAVATVAVIVCTPRVAPLPGVQLARIDFEAPAASELTEKVLIDLLPTLSTRVTLKLSLAVPWLVTVRLIEPEERRRSVAGPVRSVTARSWLACA